jgi:pSer/pThr/pTyr-binding forkhead associated (FHA) protein
MATLCLLGNDGAMAGKWEIRHEPTTVGRGASVDMKVDDDGLSRRHFMIGREGAEYVIKDLSLRNGTWVHGHRALTAKLHHNDCILAGHTLFRFCEERPAVSPALAPVSGPHGTELLFPTASTGPGRTAAHSHMRPCP